MAAALLAAPAAQAFEAFDGRLQAHGFYESQFRVLNEDYGEDWDASQWYNVFNLEIELDLLDETVGVLDLLSAFVRAEVRYDCIYSRGCGMFRSMNAYGDRSRSLPRRLSNAVERETSGELIVGDFGRVSGSNTDPLFLFQTSAFNDIADTEGQPIGGTRSDVPPSIPACDIKRSNCKTDLLQGVRPFDYTFDKFLDFKFTEVNTKIGGSNGGSPIQILGPWLPKNKIVTNAALADRVNPFDTSRLNPILLYQPGLGARPFRPIPIWAEDKTQQGTLTQQVVIFNGGTNAFGDPSMPGPITKIGMDYNGGDGRFNQNTGTANGSQLWETKPFLTALDPAGNEKFVYDARTLGTTGNEQNPNMRIRASSDRRTPGAPTTFVQGVSAPDDATARGLFLPSPPLRKLLQSGKLQSGSFPLNLSESKRQWNRGLAQEDEKELKEAYFDIEMFDSRLWMRIGKQQIVWGKTELFRTTDQFNPQDLALATLASLEETRIALWSARGVWSFYEVGPLSDFRVELAFNIDDYESSDFGSCGEPYTVNLVCSAAFGAFAHGFTGVGIIGIEAPPDPWESTKGWEIGGRLEWRWDRFSFALSDFWGYADLPTIKRISTFERNVDPQTGRPLVYDGGTEPKDRRGIFNTSYAFDAGNVGNDDPWQDPFGDLRAGLIRNENAFLARGALDPDNNPAFQPRCGTSQKAAPLIRVNRPSPLSLPPKGPAGELVDNERCLTAGPTSLFDNADPKLGAKSIFGTARTFPSDRDLAVEGSTDFLPTNALDSHPANLTIFNWVCSVTVGFLELDRTACAQTVFGSTAEPAAGLAVAEIIGRLQAGDSVLNSTLIINNDRTCDFNSPTLDCDQPSNKGSAFLAYGLPIVVLSADPGDVDVIELAGDNFNCQDFLDLSTPCVGRDVSGGNAVTFFSATLSPEQEALLGCGPFWETNCDTSGIDLLNAEASSLLQSFAGSSGTLNAISLKAQGISAEGTAIIDPSTGAPVAFRAPNEYRTDEGLQPGTLPWEALGIGGPICSTADIGGQLYPRGQDKMLVPDNPTAVTTPATRKQALPGCHRKWVDKQNGYLNPAWGKPFFVGEATGNLDFDQLSGLPRQIRRPDGTVVIDYFYSSGDPDPLGVRNLPSDPLVFPDAVYHFAYGGVGDAAPLYAADRPDVGPGHPFASRRAVPGSPGRPGRPELIVPFASEMAGLSWNFQMISVAFSEEYGNMIETVGDLADPLGQALEGGTICVAASCPPGSPARIFTDRRLIAQMLLGYCGSDYGLINSATGLGTCRLDGLFQVNQDGSRGIPALSREYQRLGINPFDRDATQDYQDQLQFVNAQVVEDEDATADDDQYEGSDTLGNDPASGFRAETTIEAQHCSFITPQYCSTVQGLFGLAGVKRNVREAGGNGAFGRRTMTWHSGGEITLQVPKRNVLGFSMDFAEDITKSNFSFEFTWIEGVPVGNADKFDNLSNNTDEYNLTVSVDRPTFINFLNPNRTLFFNSQWFFQYRNGYKQGFGGNGPFNVLGTATVFTGYFQDRLNPSITYVHDFQSFSGGLLPSINYRFSENFSATIGALWFYGREQTSEIATNGIGPAANLVGENAYFGGAQNGISIVRDRDEVFLRIRYTF